MCSQNDDPSMHDKSYMEKMGFIEDLKEPEIEEFDRNDWKILFMVLCENRGRVDLEKGLTPHGKQLLKNVQRKIGIAAVGVDINAIQSR